MNQPVNWFHEKKFKAREKFSFFHTVGVQKFLKIGHSVETSWISPILLQQDQCLQLDAICLKLAVLLLTVIVLCNVRHKHERKQKLKCCNESFWTKFRQIDLMCSVIFQKLYTNTKIKECINLTIFFVCDTVSKVFFFKQHVPQWISLFFK